MFRNMTQGDLYITITALMSTMDGCTKVNAIVGAIGVALRRSVSDSLDNLRFYKIA